MSFIKAILSIAVFLLISCTAPEMKQMSSERIGEYGPQRQYLDHITQAELKHHLTFLASDAFKGRDTGTPELKIAASYIANLLKSYGYKGLGENGSFFQRIDLLKPSYDHQSFKLTYNGIDIDLDYGKDYAVYGYGGSEDYMVEAPLVSVGYGLNNDEMNSYNPADVDGKVALRFAVEGDLWEKYKEVREFHQNLRNTLYNQGAKSVIIVVEDMDRQAEMLKRYMDIAANSQNNVTMTKEENPRLYVILTKSAYYKLAKIEKRKNSDKTAFNFKHNISLSMKSNAEEAYTQNVVAMMEGTDPKLKSEFVGFGAHYDHVGIRNGEIYNGANDDGSGTVGLLSVAKTIAENPPRRSTMIIFHAGEEKGLWGSEYFVEHPLIDLKQIVAVVNMDMIGSNHKPTDIYIVGADRISQDLHDINEVMNQNIDKINLDYEWNERFHPERIYYRSDHYNYAKKGIPVIFYSDEDPENYHKPSDTVDKINFDKLRRVTRLAYATGYTVANQPNRIKITTPVESPKYTKAFADKYVGTYNAKTGASVEVKYENETLMLYYFGRSTDLILVEDNVFNGRGYKLTFDLNGKSNAQFLNFNLGRQALDFARKGVEFPTVQTIMLSEAELNKFVGSYKLDGQERMFDITVADKALKFKMGNQPDVMLKPVSKTKFYIEAMDAYLDFTGTKGTYKATMIMGGNPVGSATQIK